MVRAIIVNEAKNYISYGHQRPTEDNFETEPHAAIQTLIKAKGSEMEGGTIYMSRYPCFECAKAIVFAGLAKLVYRDNDSADPTHMEAQLFLEHSNIEVIQNRELDF